MIIAAPPHGIRVLVDFHNQNPGKKVLGIFEILAESRESPWIPALCRIRLIGRPYLLMNWETP